MMMISPFLPRGRALLMPLLLLWGCDAAPGPVDSAHRLPALAEFMVSPEQVDLSDGDAYQVVDGHVRVPVSVNVTASHPDGQIDEVRYVVQEPERGVPIGAGLLTPEGAGRYGDTIVIAVPEGAVGKYTLLVYAVDDRGATGNSMRRLIDFVQAGQPPMIVQVVAPDVIQRPAADEPPIHIPVYVDVIDPDGQANVSHVSFWNVERPDDKFPLFNDGGGDAPGHSGDEVAGDDRLTFLVRIESHNTPGTNTLAFQAYDKTGLASEVVEKEIRVE